MVLKDLMEFMFLQQQGNISNLLIIIAYNNDNKINYVISRPDLIDPALLRPGRLDKSLLCDIPTFEERIEVCYCLELHHRLIIILHIFNA